MASVLLAAHLCIWLNWLNLQRMCYKVDDAVFLICLCFVCFHLFSSAAVHRALSAAAETSHYHLQLESKSGTLENLWLLMEL